MKQIKICYTNAPNMGDAINPIIVRRLFGYEPILSDLWNCEITGIGSGLRRFFIPANKGTYIDKMKWKIMNTIHNKPYILWSAGFLTTPNESMKAVRERFCVSSVRGMLSKRAIETLSTNGIDDCTVGDAGILASLLVKTKEYKRYNVGIIPHRSEKELPIVKQLQDYYDNSVVIDIEQNDPMEGLRLISSCNFVLSSSLHGLIFADSFRIPNRHIILSNKLSGDGFKFRDYYSVYGIDDDAIDIRNSGFPQLDEFFSNYIISDEQVFKIQEDCKTSFLKYLERC